MKESISVEGIRASMAETQDDFTFATNCVALALIDLRTQSEVNTQKLCSKLDLLIQAIRTLR